MILSKFYSIDIESNDVLRWAVTEGHLEVTRVLLEKGLNPDHVFGDGWTPLFLACYWENLEVAKLLVSKGCVINRRDQKSCTPLLVASRFASFEICKLLVDHGASVNSKIHYVNSNGQNTVKSPSSYAVKNGNIQLLNLFLENGAELNDEEDPILLFAAERGDLEMVKLVVNHGCDINQQSFNGDTALALAARNGHFNVVKLLVAYGAQLDLKNRQGRSAIDLAIRGRHYKICYHLMMKYVLRNKVFRPRSRRHLYH